MNVVRTVAELRRAAAGSPLAFVPTMGNLHAGHIALVQRARARASRVAASIFVNRLQFAPTEDFDEYPRTFESDCEKLAAAGVELVFAPDERVLYPEPQQVLVDPGPLGEELEGRFRPRFFHGVATVVLKLFNCVQPRVAVFGKKDYQQQMIIRRMVRQMALPMEIVTGETQRASDGLALSSRNGYLSAAERAEAVQLSRTLQGMSVALQNGEHNIAALEQHAMQTLAGRGWQPDYMAVRRRQDLQPPQAGDFGPDKLVVLGAARLRTTRLIDNLEA